MDGYVIDSRSTRFTVQAFATGLLAKMGHNPTIKFLVTSAARWSSILKSSKPAGSTW